VAVYESADKGVAVDQRRRGCAEGHRRYRERGCRRERERGCVREQEWVSKRAGKGVSKVVYKREQMRGNVQGWMWA
jgi:hypothetical protein